MVSALKSVDCTGAPSQAVLSLPASLPLGHPLARAMRRGRTLPTLGIPTIPHDRERPPGKEARSARTFACEDMRRIHARHAGFTRAFESQDMRSGWYPVVATNFQDMRAAATAVLLRRSTAPPDGSLLRGGAVHAQTGGGLCPAASGLAQHIFGRRRTAAACVCACVTFMHVVYICVYVKCV